MTPSPYAVAVAAQLNEQLVSPYKPLASKISDVVIETSWASPTPTLTLVVNDDDWGFLTSNAWTDGEGAPLPLRLDLSGNSWSLRQLRLEGPELELAFSPI